MNQVPLTSDLEAVLKRYLQIQQEEARLQEEKKQLQETLAGHLEQHQTGLWVPEVNGQKLKVRCTTSVSVDYDEVLLQQRLGERYAAICAPDPRKIKRHLGELDDVLKPVLGLIGSPQADKVRMAIEAGVARREEFTGAFEKTTRRIVSVAKVRQDDTSLEEAVV